MNRYLAAVLAASVSLSAFATPAIAKDSKVWNPTVEDAQTALNDGKVVCYGDQKKKRLSDCMIFNPYKKTIVSSTNVRSIAGLQKNQHFATINGADADGTIATNDDGSPIVYASNVATQENGPTLLTQGALSMGGALVNGMGAAGITTAFGPNCSGGNCGGQGVINLISTEANAASASTAATTVLSGCPGGTCPTKP